MNRLQLRPVEETGALSLSCSTFIRIIRPILSVLIRSCRRGDDVHVRHLHLYLCTNKLIVAPFTLSLVQNEDFHNAVCEAASAWKRCVRCSRNEVTLQTR